MLFRIGFFFFFNCHNCGLTGGHLSDSGRQGRDGKELANARVWVPETRCTSPAIWHKAKPFIIEGGRALETAERPFLVI